MSFFNNYYGGIRISDGKNSEWFYDGNQKITARHSDGSTVTFVTNGFKILERKHTKNGRLLEHLKFGAFQKGIKLLNQKEISAPVIFRFHPGTQKSLSGLTERWEQTLFNFPGKCRTLYSRGRFRKQDFRYQNKKIAYNFRHTDTTVTIKYPNGKVAGIVSCPNGFSTRSGERRSNEDTQTCQDGTIYFNFYQQERDLEGQFEEHNTDYSKDGNCSFIVYNRKGKIRRQGEYKNRQKVGEWVVGGRHVYFINGIEIAKKLWDTPPEKLKVKTVLKIKNAQMRAALIARIGNERFTKECKCKVIHETKNGMKLMEFPVRVDDGNGDRKGSMLRILQVTCPSTNHKYYLNVPDFVWDGGKRTKLNTCEAARQWTFGVDDPRKKIEFAVEA